MPTPPKTLPIQRPPFPLELLPPENPGEGQEVLTWALECSRIRNAQEDYLRRPFQDETYVRKLAKDFCKRFPDFKIAPIHIGSFGGWEIEIQLKHGDYHGHIWNQEGYEEWFRHIEMRGEWWLRQKLPGVQKPR